MLAISPIVPLTVDSSQHDEDSVPQLGKPVPFPIEDTPTLGETLIPPESGYHSLMDANTVAPALPMNHIFPQPSVACESFSKHFAVNITRCGDADSSTIVPGIQIPLGCESDVSTVSLAPTEVPLLASMHLRYLGKGNATQLQRSGNLHPHQRPTSLAHMMIYWV